MHTANSKVVQAKYNSRSDKSNYPDTS